MASPPETLDAPAPAQRRPVPALGEQQQCVAPAEAGRQPPDLPDLLAPVPAAGPGGALGPRLAVAEKRVWHPVGHDVQARVQLQRRLHDDPGAPLADGEQVVHQQQRIARAGVPAEHDERTVAGQQRVRRRGHLDAQPAGAPRLPVDQVEEPPHDRVVASPVGLGVEPAAEPARDPQAEQRRERRRLPERPGEGQKHHPQQPGPVTAPGQPPDQVEGRAEEGDGRRQHDQAGCDHDDERRQQQAAN
jgi:hypothetical protein